MLVELEVNNYAVVEHLRLRFHPGLNLLTGETGSGKSLVVDALGLLFGERASTDIIRSGADRARISGIFEVRPEGDLCQVLAQAGVEIEDGELLLAREILAGGKTRVFAGGRPATVALLRDISPYLGDIHGQHDQQRLLSVEAQLEMLDDFGGAQDDLAAVATLFRQWRAVQEELSELERSEQERLRQADMWTFQRNEIEGIAPAPGEDESLENERRVLQNVARLEEQTHAAYEALYDSPVSVMAQLRHARRSLDEICRIDAGVTGLRDSLKPAEVTVEEAAHELRHYMGRLEADPARLEEIESRLAQLEKLKRKYGDTLEGVLEFLHGVRSNLAATESAEERRVALASERDRVAQAYEAAAARLSRARATAATQLTERLETELKSLAMERTTFRIRFEMGPWSPRGVDKVVFLISPNPGEEPRPLDKVASGGELSRIALALKTCVAPPAAGESVRTAVPRTLVFDEVDAGVGGSAAERVGRRLKQLASGNQVLCVTHLPQIAGFADHHYYVEKHEAGGRIQATVEELTGGARVREIARMLSGEQLTQEAVRHAERLLKLAAG